LLIFKYKRRSDPWSQTNPYTPHWIQIITRAWSDPKFKGQLFNDPQAILTEYHIDKVAGREVSALAGKVKMVDGPVEGHEKPWHEGNLVMIPFPPVPRDFDTVLSPDELAIAGGVDASAEAADMPPAENTTVVADPGVAAAATSGLFSVPDPGPHVPGGTIAG
jgi:hypothetical protein